MKINAARHIKRVRIVLFFIFLTLFSTYVIAKTYKHLIDFKNTNEYVFTITPKNTIKNNDLPQKKRNDAIHKVVEFFSPTKTLIPVLVIPAEETVINNPDETSRRDAKTAIDEISRDYHKDIYDANRNDPKNINDINREDPKDIDMKNKPSYAGGGGGGGGGETKWIVGVYDNKVNYKGGITTLVDIFADSTDPLGRKIIYPGISGKYYFTVDNMVNGYNISYYLNFKESCSKYIPMEYRLKVGNVYLGQVDKWYSTAELSTLVQKEPLNKKNKVSYTLEWRWPESDNDNQYIKCGGLQYALKITVYAEAR